MIEHSGSVNRSIGGPVHACLGYPWALRRSSALASHGMCPGLVSNQNLQNEISVSRFKSSSRLTTVVHDIVWEFEVVVHDIVQARST